MAKEYKVWLDVEEYDDETDEYRNCDLGFAGTAWFPDEESGGEFAHLLDMIGSTVDCGVDDPDFSMNDMLIEIRERIETWKARRQANAETPAGFMVTPAVADGDGDANQRH